MPEGTGICLGCWEMSAHFHISRSFGNHFPKWEKKEELEKVELKNREAGWQRASAKYCMSSVHKDTLLVIWGQMHTTSKNPSRVPHVADIDKPDKGHLAFIYFAKATALVGSVSQSICSFNGLRSEKLKCCVSACLVPWGTKHVQ